MEHCGEFVVNGLKNIPGLLLMVPHRGTASRGTLSRMRARRPLSVTTSTAPRPLPGEGLQCRHLREVGVPGCQRQVILPGHRRNPEVVVRNGFTKPGEFGFDLAVYFGGVPVGEQNHGVCQKVVDECELLLPPLCPLGAKVKFTEHHSGHVHRGESGEAWMQNLVTAKICDHDIGVHQDTTSHVH